MCCSSVCGLSLAPSCCGSRAPAGRQPLLWKGFPPSRPRFSSRDAKGSLLPDLCPYQRCADTAVPVKEPDFSLTPVWQGSPAKTYRANLSSPSNRGEQHFLVWWEESKESLAPCWQPSPAACDRKINAFLTGGLAVPGKCQGTGRLQKRDSGKTKSQGETSQSSSTFFSTCSNFSVFFCVCN